MRSGLVLYIHLCYSIFTTNSPHVVCGVVLLRPPLQRVIAKAKLTRILLPVIRVMLYV